MSIPQPNPKRRRASMASPSSSSSSLLASQPPTNGLDLLTSLPDPLRRHILTFLPYSSSIRTGSLSSPWKSLWKSCHPNRNSFVVTLSLSDDKNPITLLENMSPALDDSSTAFIRRLSLSFKSSLDHLPHLNLFLNQCATHGVPDLHLDLRSPAPNFRTSSITLHLDAPFGPSLVRLSLSALRFSSDPSYFKTLVNLEYLILSRVNITDTNFRRVVANCISLRSVELRACPDLKKVVIRGKKIVAVKVMSCVYVEEMKVIGGELRKFHFGGGFAREISLEKAEALNDVYVSSWGTEIDLPVSNWVAAVGGLLRNVKVLTLCHVSLQYIMDAAADVIDDNFKNFDSLTELQLLMHSMTETNLTDVFRFLRLCSRPKLERLFIRLPFSRMLGPSLETKLEGVVFTEPPMSCLENVKNIKLYNFKGDACEFKLVRFILANSHDLESLTVVSPPVQLGLDEKITSEVHDHVLNYYRVYLDGLQKLSKKVRIDVCQNDVSGIKPAHS